MTESLAGNDVFEFEDCLLVIARGEPRLFLLNPTARLVWEAIARGLPADEVAAGIAARFGVPPARVRADVRAILAEWRAHRLLTAAPDAPAAPAAGAAAGRGRMPRRFHSQRVYALCGRAIRLRFEAAAIEQVIHPPLAHAALAGGRARDRIDVLLDAGGYLVVCNGADVERASDLEDALGQVFGRILELSYPDAEWLAMLHAAAVGDQQSAVVMVGDSGSGKSTLTGALVHAGLRYFSDDVVPLDRAWRIRPMPLGISVKAGSWPVLASRYPELEALPIHPGRPRRYLPVPSDQLGPSRGLPVTSLVFPRYCGDQRTSVRKMSILEVIERLTRVRSWLSLDRRRFPGTLDWLKKTSGYELNHASLEEGVEVIKRLLNGEDAGSSL